jgi:hypothetical protein
VLRGSSTCFILLHPLRGNIVKFRHSWQEKKKKNCTPPGRDRTGREANRSWKRQDRKGGQPFLEETGHEEGQPFLEETGQKEGQPFPADTGQEEGQLFLEETGQEGGQQFLEDIEQKRQIRKGTPPGGGRPLREPTTPSTATARRKPQLLEEGDEKKSHHS